MDKAEIERWCQEVLPFVWNEQPPPPDETDLPGGGMALLSADTDRTQSYVFQSTRLPQIRGASMLLDELNRVRLLNLLAEKGLPTGFINAPKTADRGCVIYVGGGSLLAVVPANLADKLCQEIEALYPREAGTATITAVVQPATIPELQGHSRAGQPAARQLTPEQQKRFQAGLETNAVQHLMKRQALHLRQRKDSQTAVPHFETIPFARVCNSCARRPATDTLSGLPGEAPRYLCQVCYQNDRRGRRQKSHWNKQFEEWCWRHKGISLTAPITEDLQTIGAAANRYIGYIHADGNRIGHFLEQTNTLLEYSDHSQALVQATESAVYEAIYSHLRQGQSILPFEIITIGGDDVLLIVPADKALPIARDICRGFQQQLSQNLAEAAPSMSAGVVLAPESNPIYFLHDLAKQLLKNAKRRSKDKKAACLDYMVLKSQSTLATNLKDARASDYLCVQQEQDRERTLLTGLPYTLDEVDRLLQGVRRFRQINLSPGQLHQMRREFQNGRFRGIFYYLYQRTRLNPAARAALEQIEADWGMAANNGGAPPWRALGRAKDNYHEFDTPLLDMLTLLPFVPNQPPGGSSAPAGVPPRRTGHDHIPASEEEQTHAA